MSARKIPSVPPSPSGLPVKVFSVEPGQPAFYRFLADLVGLNTHWTGKRSVPCEGEGKCPSSLHRGRVIFKAYSPAERWIPAEKHWLPGVLEATEVLEETLRGRHLRGEVWMLSRKGDGRKNDPVDAVYCETFADDVLREAFDIRPILLRFYHVAELLLGAENRIPPQTILLPSPGNQPTLPFPVEPTAAPAPTQEQIERFREMKGKLFGSSTRSRSAQKVEGNGSSQVEGAGPERNGHHPV